MHFIQLAHHDTEDVMKFLAADKEALEPLGKSLSLDKDEVLVYFESLLQEAIESGISYVVKTASDEIVAVRLSTFRTRDGAMDDVQILTYHDISTPIGQAQALLHQLQRQKFDKVKNHEGPGFSSALVMRRYAEVLRQKFVFYIQQQLKDSLRIFWAEVSPEVDKVYYLMAIVVASAYRETDVVDKLIHHNMDEVRTMGAQGLIADASVFQSETTFHKLGYRVIAEVDQGTSSPSKKGLRKAQLVFKEMWRGERTDAHVVL